MFNAESPIQQPNGDAGAGPNSADLGDPTAAPDPGRHQAAVVVDAGRFAEKVRFWPIGALHILSGVLRDLRAAHPA
jgi:hypothetical protein